MSKSRPFDEDLYRILANSSQAGVYILQDGKFQFANPHIQEYAGYTEERDARDGFAQPHPSRRPGVGAQKRHPDAEGTALFTLRIPDHHQRRPDEVDPGVGDVDPLRREAGRPGELHEHHRAEGGPQPPRRVGGPRIVDSRRDPPCRHRPAQPGLHLREQRREGRLRLAAGGADREERPDPVPERRGVRGDRPTSSTPPSRDSGPSTPNSPAGGRTAWTSSAWSAPRGSGRPFASGGSS